MDDRPPPNDKEAARIAAARDRWIDRTPPVQVAVSDEAARFRSTHGDESGWSMRLGDTLGTRSPEFMWDAMNALDRGLRSRGAPNAHDAQINADLALVAAIAPENELEAALGVQMAQTHALSTELCGLAKRADSVDQLERYVNLTTKLQRTFTTQIETLGRMRGKGQQTVRVEHVTVEAGAQAIVGDVHHHPGVQHALAQPASTLPSPDPLGRGVSVAGHAERPVPHARRSKPRRAHRQQECIQARSSDA